MRKSTCLSVLLAVGLTACGGSPSEGDIKLAVQRQVERDRAEMQRFGGPAASFLTSTAPEVQDVKKIGCKEDGERAYRCDVEIQVQQGGRVNKGPASLRVVKGSDGWLVSR